MAELWNQLDLLYMSYNPNLATGEALRNLGLISGHVYQKAQRSHCTIDLIGTPGAIIPQYSTFTDGDGNRFMSLLEATVPSSVDVMAELTGSIPVLEGAVTNIEPAIAGLDSIDQPKDGKLGGTAKSEAHFRNTRLRTVMRNSGSGAQGMESRLIELGIEQVTITNNDTDAPLGDGTPARAVHVVVGELADATSDEIAQVILNTKPIGCITHGNEEVFVDDTQGNPHSIKFTYAAPLSIFVNMTLTLLDEDIGGVTDRIKYEVSQHLNSLLAGEDVIWSRLFEHITPYGKAQVDLLEIGTDIGSMGIVNIAITDEQYPTNIEADVVIMVV
jgi:hypothetical protein